MNTDNIREFETLSDELMSNPNVLATQTDRCKELTKYLQSHQNFREVYTIFTTSQHCYLQYLCISSILTNLSAEWKKFTNDEKNYLHASLYGALTDSVQKPAYLVLAMCKVLARICRIGWIELENTRKTVDHVLGFSQTNPDCLKLALKFFKELIIEINEPIKHRSIVLNRKVAIRFRDEALGNVLNFAIMNLVQGLGNSESVCGSLEVVNLALNFDFSGTNNEDANEETNALPVPLGWKQLLNKVELFSALESCFQVENEEICFLAFKTLNNLCAVRKTIFLRSEDKQIFCGYLYSCFDLAMSKFVLNRNKVNSVNLGMFLEGVKKFLANFLVKDLSQNEIFGGFLQRFMEFSFEIWGNREVVFDVNQNGMQVWTYLSYEGISQSPAIKPIIPILFQKYIDITYELLTPSLFETDSPLLDLIECLSTFSSYFYPEVLATLIPKLNHVFSNLENNNPLPGHISWSIYLCSTMLSNTSKKSGQDLDDKLVENLAGVVPKLINLAGCVEQSIIFFCQVFGSVYLSSSSDNYWGDSSSVLFENTLGQISMLVLEVIFNSFHKYSNGEILNSALNLFEKLCSGYFSNKIITSLPAAFSLINYPVCNFTEQKMRSSLFTSLTQLWASEPGNLQVFFELLGQKIKVCNGNEVETQNLFVELLGISKALNTERLFKEFFDVVNEDIWIIVEGFKVWNGQLEGCKRLLRFFTELLENRNNRIRFETGEACGIIMFKNLSQVVAVFSQVPATSETDCNSKVKIVLRLVNNLFRGNFISFGVFEVYNDSCYLETLLACFQLIHSTVEVQRYPKVILIIFEFFDILCKSHQKVLLTAAPEICFRSMMKFFVFAFKSDGSQVSINHVILAAGSLYSLCEFLVKTVKKQNSFSQTVKIVLEREAEVFEEVFEGVFEILLNHDGSAMWAVNKPLLALAIIFEEKYHRTRALAISKFSNNLATREELEKAFANLFVNVNKNLDTKNKDVFTKNFTEFKQTLSSLT